MHRLTLAAEISLAMLACTAPNPGAALDLEPDDYAEVGTVADAAGGDATRSDDGDVPEDDAVPGRRAPALVDPAGVARRPVGV